MIFDILKYILAFLSLKYTKSEITLNKIILLYNFWWTTHFCKILTEKQIIYTYPLLNQSYTTFIHDSLYTFTNIYSAAMFLCNENITNFK